MILRMVETSHHGLREKERTPRVPNVCEVRRARTTGGFCTRVGGATPRSMKFRLADRRHQR
jgi:hypothetical protein